MSGSESHSIDDHIHGDPPNTTMRVGRLRFFVPKHLHTFAIGDPTFSAQCKANPVIKILQEQLDDGTWIDVPVVYEAF